VTHAYLGLAAFDLMATAIGYALLNGLGLVRSRAEALRYLGLAFLAGWATTGVAISLGVSLGVDPRVRNVLLLTTAAIALCLGARRLFPASQRPPLPADRDLLPRAAGLAGAGLLVMAMLGSLVFSARAGADYFWDAWAFWVPKAKAIYYFHGLDTGLGGFLTYANPEYPPLVPATTAATFHFMGGVHPAALPLQQSLLGVAFVASVVVLLAPRVPRWILFPLLAMLALAPQFWFRMASVVPDQTTAYLLALALVASILWIDERRRAWLPLAAVFMAGATLTKPEGLALSVLLVVVVAAAALLLHGRSAYPVLALAFGPAAILPWRAWLAHHHVQASPPYDWNDLLRPGFLADRADRLGFAAHKMLDFILGGASWSLVLPLTVAGLVLAFVAGTLRVLTAAVAAWLGVAFLGLAAVYWIGKPEVHWYVNTSAERVVGTIPLMAGTVLPLLLALALERRRQS
jgi:hypothetical protein